MEGFFAGNCWLAGLSGTLAHMQMECPVFSLLCAEAGMWAQRTFLLPGSWVAVTSVIVPSSREGRDLVGCLGVRDWVAQPIRE